MAAIQREEDDELNISSCCRQFEEMNAPQMPMRHLSCLEVKIIHRNCEKSTKNNCCDSTSVKKLQPTLSIFNTI